MRGPTPRETAAETRLPCSSHFGRQGSQCPPEEAAGPLCRPLKHAGAGNKYLEALLPRRSPLVSPEASHREAGGVTSTRQEVQVQQTWSSQSSVPHHYAVLDRNLFPSVRWGNNSTLLHRGAMKMHCDSDGKCGSPNLSHDVKRDEETSTINFIYCALFHPRIPSLYKLHNLSPIIFLQVRKCPNFRAVRKRA